MRLLKILLTTLLLIMAAFTALCYSPDAKLLLVNTSAGYMVQVAAVHPLLPTALLVLFAVAQRLYYIEPGFKKFALLSAILLSWFLSGRIIATKIYPDGTVSTAWFYIPTQSFDVCHDVKFDCEAMLASHTITERLSFWRLRIRNENTDRTIFVGPFVWGKANDLLCNEWIGKGSYTPPPVNR